MPKIAIITDSDASLPADLAQRHQIHQVPITVHFGEEVLETGVDIDDAALFARVDREGKLPTTAAPSPGKFAAAFETALAEGADEIACFCVSGEVSATYNAACVARDMFPDQSITVVDTRTLTMGQGFMVLAAARAAEAGASVAELVAEAESVRERTHLYASLSTLKYLAMSGRVGHLTAGMAGLLRVKPILTIRDGKLDLLERVRTQKRAWGRVLELTEMAVNGRSISQMAIVHSNARAEAEQFAAQLRKALPCPADLFYAELTAGMSVHSGAGMVGVCLVAAE